MNMSEDVESHASSGILLRDGHGQVVLDDDRSHGFSSQHSSQNNSLGQTDDDGERGEDEEGYFDRMSHLQREAFHKLYENTLEGPCSALVACEQNIEQNLKEINCGQQLLFSWNARAGDRGGAAGVADSMGVDDVSMSMGMGGMFGPGPGGMPLIEKCEYCHSDTPQLCHTAGNDANGRPKCERPEFFFLHKKPPLATNHEAWDSATGYPIQADGKGPFVSKKSRSKGGFFSKLGGSGDRSTSSANAVPWYQREGGGGRSSYYAHAPRLSSTASTKSKMSPVRTSSMYGVRNTTAKSSISRNFGS